MNSPSPISPEHLASIRAALERINGTRLPGSQLRTLVDLAAPDLDIRAAVGIPVGPGALTQLLKAHFSDIVEPVGKIGGDTIFLVGHAQPDLINPDNLPRPGVLWGAFASRSLNKQVVFNRETKSLTVQPRGTPAPAEGVLIEPMSANEFQSIAENFMGTVPQELQEELRAILEQGDLFYQSWVAALKTHSIAVYHRWGLFRVQHIIGFFRERLANAQLPHGDIEEAVDCLTRDQNAAYKDRGYALRASSVTVPLQPSAPQASRERPISTSPVSAQEKMALGDARAIATLLINNMSLTELRQISVPLGAILDAALLPRT